MTLQDSSCRSIGAFVGGDAFEDGAQGHVGGELRLGARVGSWSCGWELWLGAVAESCGWGLSMGSVEGVCGWGLWLGAVAGSFE